MLNLMDILFPLESSFFCFSQSSYSRALISATEAEALSSSSVCLLLFHFSVLLLITSTF